MLTPAGRSSSGTIFRGKTTSDGESFFGNISMRSSLQVDIQSSGSLLLDGYGHLSTWSKLLHYSLANVISSWRISLIGVLLKESQLRLADHSQGPIVEGGKWHGQL